MKTMNANVTLPIEESLKNSMVKVYTVYDKPDYYRPWQMQGQASNGGSGCIIEGQRILTNAHVVADHTFIQAERAGRAGKQIARVENVAHECDLAILKVDDDSFFAGSQPVALGSLPEVKDKIAVYGFPMGGTKLAITEGVVSRVENLTYSHSFASLLYCQIDAPINPGSSGGPVVKDGKIVGVAFQGSEEGQNIGYMVPAPLVARFLSEIEKGGYGGIPTLGIAFQKMENPALRRRYHMGEEDSGVLVCKVDPRSPAKGILEPGDVILAVDGFDVANDGTVEFRKGERTIFFYALQRHFLTDAISMDVLRGKDRRTVDVALTLRWEDSHLVPRPQYEKMPTYYIIGGLVFSPITSNLLLAWHDIEEAPRKLARYYYEDPDPDRDEVVTLIQVLSHEVNVGYDYLYYTVIESVNGKEIRGMRDLVETFEGHTGDYHTIVNEDGARIVLSRKDVEKGNEEILRRYRIPSDRSEDLRNLAAGRGA